MGFAPFAPEFGYGQFVKGPSGIKLRVVGRTIACDSEGRPRLWDYICVRGELSEWRSGDLMSLTEGQLAPWWEPGEGNET